MSNQEWAQTVFVCIGAIGLVALWRIAELLGEVIKQLRLIKWWIAHGQGERLDPNV